MNMGMVGGRFHSVSLTFAFIAIALCSCAALSEQLGRVEIRNLGLVSAAMPLHVDGRYVRDSKNETVSLRGVNCGGMGDRPFGWWNREGQGVYSGLEGWDPDAVRHNLDGIKVWGFNTIRMHTCVEYWVTNPDSYEGIPMPQSYRDNIKEIVQLAGQRGIYVILDFYCVQYYTTQDPLPFPPYSLNGSERFIPDVQTFVNVWRSLAIELGHYPNVLFELWNEPHAPAGSNATQAKVEWFDAVQMCTNAIRETCDNIIVVQWEYGVWCNFAFPPPNPASTMDWVFEYPINGSNVLYSFHLYRGAFHDTSAYIKDSYAYSDIIRGLDLCKVDDVLNASKPVICGEIGANMWETGDNLERELAWFNNSLVAFTDLGVGYAAFEWRDTATGISYGLLVSGRSFIPPPNRAGVVVINNTNRNPFVFTAGSDSYLYRNNLKYTQKWFLDNKTLHVEILVNQSGFLRIFWKYPVGQETMLSFSNGSAVPAYPYFDPATSMIILPVNPASMVDVFTMSG